MSNTHFNKEATDLISGLKGVVAGCCEYSTGCTQYLLQPRSEDSTKKLDSYWIDEDRLEFSENEVVKFNKTINGSDKQAPLK